MERTSPDRTATNTSVAPLSLRPPPPPPPTESSSGNTAKRTAQLPLHETVETARAQGKRRKVEAPAAAGAASGPSLAAAGAASGPSPRLQSYVAMIEYHDPAILAEVFGDCWRRVSVEDAVAAGTTDALFIDGSAFFDKRTYGSVIKCGFKSRVEDPTKIMYKFGLHELLMADPLGSQAIPRCILVDITVSRYPPALPPGVWIWRPAHRKGGGKGVAVIQSQSELNRHVEKLSSFNVTKGLITQYVVNPLLYSFKGQYYKFNLRMYYIVVCSTREPREKRVGLFHKAHICLAQKPYRPGQYWDQDIHDARWAASIKVMGRDSLLEFPRDYPGGERKASSVFSQVSKHLTQVARLTLPKLRCWDGSEVGYNVYGVDVLVTDNDHAYLVEINANPGYDTLGKGPKREIATWLYSGVKEFVHHYNADSPLIHVTPLYTSGW